MTNFTPYSLLTADALNAEFNAKADLKSTQPQQFQGQVNAPVVDAALGVTTADLTVSGTATFSTTDAITMPVGSTLQRPFPPVFGQIRANNTTGTYEAVSPTGTWNTLVTTPAATVSGIVPSGLAAPAFGQATSTSIPVSWRPPSAGTPPYLYTLQYRTAGTSNWINWLTDIDSSTTTATISGLLNATRYEFQVLARNTIGSTTSPTTSSSTLGYNSGGPSNLTATNPTSSTIHLSWTPVVSSPVAYQVRYALPNSAIWTEFAQPTSDTAITVYGLSANQAYLFQVLAKNTSGSYESSTINASTAAAATAPPNAPTGLTVPTTTLNSITLTWFAPTNGSGPFAYQIEYQISGASVWTGFKTPTTDTTLTVTGLNSATNYLLHVIAINSAGTATSSSFSGTTLSALPTYNNLAESQTTAGLPQISGPVLGAVGTSSAISGFGITVDDPPAAYLLGSMIASVKCGSGTVTMIDSSNNPVQGSGTNSISSFPATLAGLQFALSTLTYTASASTGTDSIRITVTDQLTQQSILTVNMTVVAGSGGVPSPSPSPSPSGGGRVTPTGQPTDAGGLPANRVSDVTQRIAVVARFENSIYNAGYTTVQAAIVENQINYIGNGGYLRIVRAICSGNMNASWLAQISQNCGSFNYILAGDGVAPSLYTRVEEDMQTMASAFQIVSGLEGFNPGPGGAYLLQSILAQAAINALATGLGVTSYQLAVSDETSAATVGTYNLRANVGTAQGFFTGSPNGPYGPAFDLAGGLHEKLLRAQQSNPGGTNAIVACGYQMFGDAATPIASPNWVSQTVAAKYLLEAILDGYKQGAYYIGLHELLDADGNYGLFTNAGSPKAAAQALRFFFQLMADPSFMTTTFFPGNLNYTITSSIQQYGGYVNTGLQQLLLQNAAGTFFLWLWNEQPLNDSATNATVVVSNSLITLTFAEGAMQSVALYDPINQNLVGGVPQPYQVFRTPSSVTISLPAWPICAVISHA